MPSHQMHNGLVQRLMRSRSFSQIVTHFAPLLFIGLMITGIAQNFWDLKALYRWSPPSVIGIFLCNGLLLGGTVLFLVRRYRPHSPHPWILVSVGFASGVLPLGLVLSVWILEAVTVFTVFTVVLRVLDFLRTVASVIAPNRYPSWKQVGMLLYTYLSLLTAFTLINLGLDLLHVLHSSMSPAFNFSAAGDSPMVNAFYFSVVVMTTLGFGDITPLTSLAKISVSLQCLTSYIMFALLVGIAMRGVLSECDE